jgi:hypothetical protein
MKPFIFIAGLMICLSAQVFAQLSIVQLYDPPLTKAAVATGNGWMQFPRAFGFDVKTANNDLTRKILLSWGVSEDDDKIPSVFNRRISPDGGVGYWATVTSPNVNFGNALKKRDGTILCMPYNVIRDSLGINEKQFKLNYFTSTNDGLTFDSLQGTLNFPFNVNWVKITRGVIESEGALYMPFYTAYQGYPGSRCVIAKSVDQGHTWSWYSDITSNAKDANVSYDEVTIAVCPNGDWLSVFRRGEWLPISYCRSTDKGLHWSTAAVLPGLPTGSHTNIDDFNESVDPMLQLMPNGIMVLSYGRPNSHLAFSADNGYSWGYLATSFKEVAGYLPGVGGKQSTNYLATVPLGYNKFMQYGDTGGDFTYRDPNGVINNHPPTNPYSIWQKPFEMVTNRQNRIDLKKKILNSWVTEMPATTLTFTTPAHPETRKLGAVDGSMDYWSAAMGTNSGVYQLDLQKTYRLNSVGIGMLYEKLQSVTFQYATAANPTTWITIPDATQNNVVNRSIQYTDFTPVEARYIKVTVSGTGQVGLGELELYEASSTFEGNAASANSVIHGLMPYGYALYGNVAGKHGISVRDVYGYASNRALCLFDGDSSYLAGLKKVESASNKKILEFRFRAAAIPGGQFISMRILGMASGSENTVFYLVLKPDGSLMANQGTGGFSHTVAGPGTIAINPTSPWRLIKIVADESANVAYVYLDGSATPVGSFSMYTSPASTTSLTGFAFASYGTLTWGELAYFDDINFYNPDSEGPSGIAANAAAGEIQLNSKLSSQNEELTRKFSITLSPNPTSEFVKLIVQNSAKGIYEVHFSDMLGRRVKRLTFNSDGETAVQEIAIPGFSSGIYIVTVSQGSHITQKKLIVK